MWASAYRSMARTQRYTSQSARARRYTSRLARAQRYTSVGAALQPHCGRRGLTTFTDSTGAALHPGSDTLGARVDGCRGLHLVV